MIKIEKPQIKSDELTATLQTYVTIDSKRELIWFEVDKKYKSYLCYERGDAFVIAVLNYAMRNGHNIESEAPLSEELYYNMETYLINALVNYNSHFHRTQINAPIASDKLPCANAVGTGISCGVDSLHALACQTNQKFIKHNITHLTFNNVGSHGEGEKAKKLYQDRLVRPKNFAEEYGFELVINNSNLMDVIEQSHFKTHTYSSLFAVYCLQKLYSTYFYASAGFKYDEFTLEDRKNICCGSYEIFSLALFSTRNLRIYSEGEGLSRLQKLKSVVKYVPSYNYLDVCLKSYYNCGTCEKCIRTLLGIDILGKIDHYKNVFNIEYYKKNKKWYLQQMLYQINQGKHDYFEMYPYFKKEITLFMKLKAFVFQCKNILPKGLKKSCLGQFIKHLIK